MHHDVDDPPDPALAILGEHAADLVGLGEIDGVHIDLCAVLLLWWCVGREGVARELGDALEGLGRRVVVVIDGDDLVSPHLLQCKNDVRACGSGLGSRMG